ncbi:hypothetical protein B0H11DRAFT_1937592 [Mycena galericulata]|nr:hypothetical protein B0H11DRAFT_1937592 [Mycena galericulata]
MQQEKDTHPSTPLVTCARGTPEEQVSSLFNLNVGGWHKFPTAMNSVTTPQGKLGAALRHGHGFAGRRLAAACSELTMRPNRSTVLFILPFQAFMLPFGTQVSCHELKTDFSLTEIQTQVMHKLEFSAN